jgi:hypothetical protein
VWSLIIDPDAESRERRWRIVSIEARTGHAGRAACAWSRCRATVLRSVVVSLGDPSRAVAACAWDDGCHSDLLSPQADVLTR